MSALGTLYFDRSDEFLGEESRLIDLCRQATAGRSLDSGIREPAHNNSFDDQQPYKVAYQIIVKTYKDLNPESVITHTARAEITGYEAGLNHPKTAEVIRVFDTWRPIKCNREEVLRILLGTARRLEDGNWFLALENYRSEHQTGSKHETQIDRFPTKESLTSHHSPIIDIDPKVFGTHLRSEASTTHPGTLYEQTKHKSRSNSRENRSVKRHTYSEIHGALRTHQSSQDKTHIKSRNKSLWSDAESKRDLSNDETATKPTAAVPIIPEENAIRDSSAEPSSQKGAGFTSWRASAAAESGADEPRSSVPGPEVPPVSYLESFKTSQAELHYLRQLTRRSLAALSLYRVYWVRQRAKAELGASFRRTSLLSRALFKWSTYLNWGRSLLSLLNNKKQFRLLKVFAAWKTIRSQAVTIRLFHNKAEQFRRQNLRTKAFLAWDLFLQRERAGRAIQAGLERKLKLKYLGLMFEEYEAVIEMRRDYGELVQKRRLKTADKFFGVWYELAQIKVCEGKAARFSKRKLLSRALGAWKQTVQVMLELQKEQGVSSEEIQGYRDSKLLAKSFQLLFANWRAISEWKKERAVVQVKSAISFWKEWAAARKSIIPTYSEYQLSLGLRAVNIFTGRSTEELASDWGFNRQRLVHAVQSQTYCTLLKAFQGWNAQLAKKRSFQNLQRLNLLQNSIDTWKNFKKTEQKGRKLAQLHSSTLFASCFSKWLGSAQDLLRQKHSLIKNSAVLSRSRLNRAFCSWRDVVRSKHLTVRRLEQSQEEYLEALLAKGFRGLIEGVVILKREKELEQKADCQKREELLLKSFTGLRTYRTFSQSCKRWEESCTLHLHKLSLRIALTSWRHVYMSRGRTREAVDILEGVFKSVALREIATLPEWESKALEAAQRAVQLGKIRTGFLGLKIAVQEGKRLKEGHEIVEREFLKRRFCAWRSEVSSMIKLSRTKKTFGIALMRRSFAAFYEYLTIARTLKSAQVKRRQTTIKSVISGWQNIVEMHKKAAEFSKDLEVKRNTSAALGSFSVWKQLFAKIREDKSTGRQIEKILKLKFWSLWLEARKGEKDTEIIAWRRGRLFQAFKLTVCRLREGKVRLAENEGLLTAKYERRLVSQCLGLMREQSAGRAKILKRVKRVAVNLEGYFEKGVKDLMRWAVIHMRERSKKAKEYEKLFDRCKLARRKKTWEKCLLAIKEFTTRLRNQKQGLRLTSKIMFNQQLKYKVFNTIRDAAAQKSKIAEKLLKTAELLEIQQLRVIWAKLLAESSRVRKLEQLCEALGSASKKKQTGSLWASWFGLVLKRRAVTEKGKIIKHNNERSLIGFVYNTWQSYMTDNPASLYQRSKSLASAMQTWGARRSLYTLHSRKLSKHQAGASKKKENGMERYSCARRLL